MKKDYRIGINALCYSTQRAGVSNYTFNLIQAIFEQSPEREMTLFLPSSARKDFLRFQSLRIVCYPANGLLLRLFFEQVWLPLAVRFHGICLLHSVGNVLPVLSPVPNIVTVHDVYFRRDINRFSWYKRFYLSLFVSLSLKRASRIICVSEYTKSEIIHFYKTPDKLLSVIYEGSSLATEPNQPNDQDLMARCNLQQPFFLFVGTLEPGKNIVGLLDAFRKLPDLTHLAIVGKKGWGFADVQQRIEAWHLDGRVHFTGYVPDSDLVGLYRLAISLVQPSFHEGFGLPVIEAMQLGCPVCASNTSSLPEVAGDAALLFDPHDTNSIKHCMEEVMRPEVRMALVQRGRRNAKRFDWTHCGADTLALYDSVIGF